MRIKSTIAILLSVIMLLGFVPSSMAVDYEEYKLELVKCVTNYDLRDTQEVSRAQFAKLLAYAMTGGDIESNAKYFIDVADSSFAAPSISYLASMGIVSGDGTSFYPDNAIKRNEAVTMLVLSLGYNVAAEQEGGYFTGYNSVASKLKLFDNVANGETLTGKDAMMLLYNTMHQKMLQETVYSGDKVESTVTEITFLAAYRKIYKITGKVNATANVALGGYSSTGRNAITVGNITLEKCPAQYDTYIGRKVDAYYYDGNEAEVVFVRDRSESYKIYTAEEIDDSPTAHSSRNIKLKNSSKSIKISQYADVIFNGKLIVPQGSDFAFKDGYVEIFEGNSGAELVIINSVEYKKVTSIDETQQIIHAVGNTGAAAYDIDDSLSIIITDESGNEITLNNIVNDDLLEVMQSRDIADKDKIIRIKRVRNAFKGTVTSIGENESGVRILGIDGTEYKTTRDFNESADGGNIENGDYALFYINSLGEVALAKLETKSSITYGYLLEGESKSNISSQVNLKIYSQENKCEILPLADKVTFNNVKTNKMDVFAALSGGGSDVNQQMLKYSLNSDGEISTLYTAVSYNYTDEDTKKLQEYNGTDEFYGVMGYKYRYTAAQYILSCTTANASFYPGDAVAYFNLVRASSGRITEDDIYVSSVPHLADGPTITCDIYDYGYSGSAKCLMAEIDDRTHTMDYNFLLINKVKNSTTEDNDDTVIMYGFKQGKKIIYEPSRYFRDKYPLSTIKPGDIMIAAYDRATFGLLEECYHVYNPADNWESSKGVRGKSTTNFWSSEASIIGEAYSREGAALCIDVGTDKYTVSTNHLTKYYYYDAEAKEYVVSTGAEILTLMESGVASRIVAKLRYGLCYDVVIYN